MENQKEIEAAWNATFGDRKNEIVFIGQDMDEQTIKYHLDAFLQLMWNCYLGSGKAAALTNGPLNVPTPLKNRLGKG